MLKIIKRLKFNTHIRILLIVAFIWLFGIALGCWVAEEAGEQLLSYSSAIVVAKVNLFWMIVRSAGPLILAFLIARYGRREYLYLLLFAKSLLLGFTISLLSEAFGSAGWLLVPLIFTCELLGCFFLLLYVLHLLLKRQVVHKKLLTTCVFLVCVFTFFDYFIFVPFTASLFRT